MSQDSNTYRCKHCANELKPDQMVCDYCGQEREGYEHRTYTSENYTHSSGANEHDAGGESSRASYGEEYSDVEDKVADLLPYIRKGREYYARKFHKMKKSNKNNSWNWCGFFFGAYWMAYRKMYVPALVVMVACQFIENYIVNLALAIAIGVLGNYFYMMTIEKYVAMEKRLPSGQDRELYINKKAGTNVWAVIGFLVIAIIL
ncbi:MAG: DUF2628 domain-containing protein [Eubacteriales bacterium]